MCLPINIIYLICYYIDDTIDMILILNCIMSCDDNKRFHIQVRPLLEFNYVIMFDIIKNNIHVQLNVYQNGAIYDYTFELQNQNSPKITYTEISSEELLIDQYQMFHYSDEIKFMNYYMTRYNYKKYIDVVGLSHAGNTYERKDNIITTYCDIPIDNIQWQLGRITRKIKDETKFKHVIMILKLLIDIMKHRISNHLDVRNNNELDNLI